MSEKTGTVRIHVLGLAADGRLRLPLAGALVKIYKHSAAQAKAGKAASPPQPLGSDATGADGTYAFDLPDGQYYASATFKDKESDDSDWFHICEGETRDVTLYIDLNADLTVWSSLKETDLGSKTFTHFDLNYRKPFYVRFEYDWQGLRIGAAADGATVRRLPSSTLPATARLRARQTKAAVEAPSDTTYSDFSFTGTGGEAHIWIGAGDGVTPGGWSSDIDSNRAPVTGPEVSEVEGDLSVALKRTASRETGDLALWAVIRRATDALGFDRYMDFMNWIFCGEDNQVEASTTQRERLKFNGGRRFLPFTDTDAYRNVKAATEAFVMANCGIVDKFHPDEAAYISDYVSINVSNLSLSQLLKSQYLVGLPPDRILPYLAVIRAKLADERIKADDIGSVDLTNPTRSIDSCYGILKDRLQSPCLLELIWSYWQEEGMLVQSMNAVTRRFQNMRSPGVTDPLANLEIDPLRSLNNLLWGVIQDEQHRLSVVRRNYEYDHHYGLRLAGKAVDGTRTADSRSKFLEAFHTLLSIVGAFYKRDDDTTMVADGFPVLNALKEAHLILSQGAHNQFGDLPSTARVEMLMQQWILARPEFREFIPTRIMVAYPEPWMDRVDAMKKLQNWTDTSVLHFRNLAIFGEQILLGIRYGNWNSVFQSVQAVNWARYWRPQIQGYMHAYRSVTGVDLSVDVTNASIDAMMPSVHLVRRLADQKRAS